MDGDGSQQNDAGSSPWADDSAADVVEQGGRRIFPSLNRPSMNWRPPRGAAILLAVGLIIGLAAGYAAGYRQAPRNATALPATTSMRTRWTATAQLRTVIKGAAITGTVLTGGLALTQDTGTCSVQSGRELQLGVQVANRSAEPIGLGRIRTVLPLSGLKVVSQQWAPCGAIGAVQVPDTLGPGDSTWLSVTIQVLVACPAPIPVQFAVGYTYAGEAATANLPGFPDLGDVPYTGCRSG
ncbi:MAG: hypothetical protein ACXVW7_16350 [Trebonia sp.]